MKALKITGIVLLGIIAIVAVLGLIAPKGFKIERSIIIPSSNKEVVYKNISTWADFLKWNPWMAKDPDIKLDYKGVEGQVDSYYHWQGNDSVGEGSMTITSITPFEKVNMDLHFIKPFETTNKTVFTMKPETNGYKVSWEMSGLSAYPFNIINLFMDMEKIIGPDFEKGLNMLKDKVILESSTDTAAVKVTF